MVQGSSSIRELSTRMKKDVPSTFNRIREWNKWSGDESDVFKRFIFRWISFNGLYNAHHERKGGGKRDHEWKIIVDFCNDFVNGRLASGITKSDAIRVFKEKIKDTTDMGDWLYKIDNQSMSEDERAKAAVMVAYKIRCRLFHGQKNPGMDVNKTVCKAADLIVSKILGEFLLR